MAYRFIFKESGTFSESDLVYVHKDFKVSREIGIYEETSSKVIKFPFPIGYVFGRGIPKLHTDRMVSVRSQPETLNISWYT